VLLHTETRQVGILGLGPGRRIFDNIKKAIAFIFALHAPISGLSMLPVFLSGWLLLFPVHIVFLELIVDPTAHSSSRRSRPRRTWLERPPRNAKERLFWLIRSR